MQPVTGSVLVSAPLQTDVTGRFAPPVSYRPVSAVHCTVEQRFAYWPPGSLGCALVACDRHCNTPNKGLHNPFNNTPNKGHGTCWQLAVVDMPMHRPAQAAACPCPQPPFHQPSGSSSAEPSASVSDASGSSGVMPCGMPDRPT